MLNSVSDLQTELLVRNNRTTTDSFITDAMLQDWTRDAHVWACSAYKWPFTEGRISTTFTTGTGYGSDEWNFEGIKADSIRLLYIGGKRLQKVNFDDYNRYKEDEPDGDDRIFTDYGKVLFINNKVDCSGTLTVWGQYQPILDPTDLTAVTAFSNWNDEGNEAIVEKMTSYLKRREHLVQEAELHDQRAKSKLDDIWKSIGEEQFSYHTKDRGLFERIDVLNGTLSDDSLNENQF